MKYNFDYINPQIEAETRRQASINRLVDRKLSYQEFDNAFVLPSKDLWKDGKCPGGVVTADGVFVESSAWHEGNRCCAYDFDTSLCRADSRTVIYMGFYNPCWGHAITDNLKKLWFLDTEEGHQMLDEGAVPIYITISNLPMPKYIHRLFQLAGVSLADFEHVTELTRFSRIIVPDNSFIADRGQRYFTSQYVDIIERIKQNVSPTVQPTGKIYFTRTGIKSTRERGESDIEKVFQKKGYKIISPEKESVDEQIRLLAGCDAFAATEGSVSHNAVFCPAHTPVTIIRKCNDVNKYQMAVNEVADVDVTYVDAHCSIMTPKDSPWVGPFYLCVNRNLERWAGHHIFHLNRRLRPSWWAYLNQQKRWYNRLQRVLGKIKL